jgi:gentisate 1,2-dioxygenase
MEGDGAFTALDGEKAVMQPFDLVLTPNWQWHDHGNDSGRPMIWLDGLDIPTVRHLPPPSRNACRAAPWRTPRRRRPATRARATAATSGPSAAAAARGRPAGLPLFHYPYAEWRDSLSSWPRHGDADPHLGHALEFVNPADGGPVMPTIARMSACCPRLRTRPRRATDATVFVVVEGSGTAEIDGQARALSGRDLLVVPSWAELTLRAERDLVLFAYSDAAAQRKLGLWREALH